MALTAGYNAGRRGLSLVTGARRDADEPLALDKRLVGEGGSRPITCPSFSPLWPRELAWANGGDGPEPTAALKVDFAGDPDRCRAAIQ